MSRPLPATPGSHPAYGGMFDRQEMYGRPSNYFSSSPYSSANDDPKTTLRGGTLLHKGFYDLLAMIPTPSPSRLIWGNPSPQQDPIVAGPRYEQIQPGLPPTLTQAPITPSQPPVSYSSPASPPKKGRRISKDMVSNPTGFVHLVHASDAYQAEALLTRWGPDGVGKLGDPRWANPIKSRVRQNTRAMAINQVVSAMMPAPGSVIEDDGRGPLRVVNGISTTTSSTMTTAARENVTFSPTTPTFEGPPAPGRPGNSTIRWAGGLQAHPEEQEHGHDQGQHQHSHAHTSVDTEDDLGFLGQSSPRKPIIPSLATLEKAVSARIYFENLYFGLFRHTPSRDQRRVAMERDMLEMQMGHSQKEQLRARWRQNETEYLRDRRRKVDVSAFTKLKTIGHGAFGVVSLVKERGTGNLYAMKQLRKTDMLRKGQEGHVRAERDILKSASLVQTPERADWIVKLHYSFQDQDNLYLVLEYMGGGDLLNLLIERDIFEEDFTRFYIAEMIMAVETCHKHGFIHRDIKPDNFLFDPDGHIKLSDFGLATDLHWAHDTSYYEQQRLHLLHKHGIDLEDTNGIADGRKTKRMDSKDVEALMGGGDGTGGIFTWREKNRRKLAYSVCGTNSYMSPEVIRGHGYSYSCDWWSLGVIMFECLYGFPPFVSKSRHDTRKMILNWKAYLKFPSNQRRTGDGVALPRVSHEGVSLMKQLLCEPEDRLGSQASASVSRPDSLIMQARRSGFSTAPGGGMDGADLIKAHPWFRGIDWQNMHRYPAPYRPDLSHPEDTRHFDDDIPAEPLAPANGAPADATRDPMLRDKVHGEEILHVRKALAFAGFTHKSPRAISYVRADKAFDPLPNTYGQTPDDDFYSPAMATIRGRSNLRQSAIGRGRPLSM